MAMAEEVDFTAFRPSARSLPLPPTAQRESLSLRGATHQGIFHSYSTTRAYHFTSALPPSEQPSWLARSFEFILPAGSVRGSVFNLCSATMGAGTLSLAYGFKMAGVIPSLLMLLLAGVLTIYSIWLLVDIYERTGIRTYEESTELILGSRMRRVVEVLTIAYCYGCAVAYVVVIGDVLHPVTQTVPLLTRNRVMVFFWTLFMLPASCLREVSSLRYTSFGSVLCIVYVTSVIVILSLLTLLFPPAGGVSWLAEVKWWMSDWKFCLSMPMILFAYSCQVNVFAIYDELVDRKPTTMVRVTIFSFVLCFTIYSSAGLMGYLAYLGNTQGDIFENLDFLHSGILVKLAFVTMAAAVTASFPLCVFPLRTSLNLLVWDTPQLQSDLAHLWETLGICVSILVLAMVVPGIQVVFQLVGSLTAATLCYVLPGWLGISAGCTKNSLWHTVGVVVLVVVGSAVGVLGTWTTIWDLLH